MIDLHMHTKYSDGSDTCTEILENVQRRLRKDYTNFY